MPLTEKGKKIKRAMLKSYGKKGLSKEDAKEIFFKYENKHKRAGLVKGK